LSHKTIRNYLKVITETNKDYSEVRRVYNSGGRWVVFIRMEHGEIPVKFHSFKVSGKYKASDI
jgi:hypothetical protein